MIANVGVWAAAGSWSLLAAHAAWTDQRTGTISRRACWTAGTAIAILLGVAAAALGDIGQAARTAAGTAAVMLAGEILYRWRPDAVGYGDIRLVTVNSLLLAWWGPQWPWWALAAGTAAATPQALIATLRRGPGATVRCAPALSLGAGVVLASRLAAAGPTP